MSASDQISPLQFDYRPNLKNKPNAQGTLFQVPTGMRTAESRQPRGYSPERFRQVGEAMGMRTHPNAPPYKTHEFGGNRMLTYPGHAETLARTWSAIARSTVPLSDITPRPDAPKSPENPGLRIGVYNKTPQEMNANAQYSRPGLTAYKDMGSIAMANTGTETSGITPIHEIGHHVDVNRPIPQGTHPSDRLSKLRYSGEGEGFADKYAEQHARQPGRKSRPVNVPSRPQDWTHREDSSWYPSREDTYGRQSFAHGYNTERHGAANPYYSPVSGNVISKDQFHQEYDAVSMGPNTYPKGHIPGQGRLLGKVGGEITGTHYDTRTGRSTHTYGPPRWEYPTHE